MEQEEFRKKIIKTRGSFFLEKVLGVKYWNKMLDIFDSVLNNRRTGVSGCTCSSKTYTAACIAICWLMLKGQPSRVITIAPTNRQVEMNMWGYLPQLHKKSRVKLGGLPTTRDWKLDRDWYAKGFSPDDAGAIKGIHGQNDLVIIDDAQNVKREIIDALELALANGKARVLLLFNREKLTGETYDMFHSKKSFYNVVQISAYNTPNVKEGKVIIDGMITKEMVNDYISKFGANSDFVKVFIKDEFPGQEAESLIPVEWIDLAMQREPKDVVGHDIICGLDIALTGDRSILTPMRGLETLQLKEYPRMNDPMELAKLVKVDCENMNASAIYGDELGIGSGVVWKLKELDVNSIGVKVSESPIEFGDDPMGFEGISQLKFNNIRSQIGWMYRMALNPKNKYAISLPENQSLKEEILAQTYHTHKHTIQLDPKELVKKKIGRSPDCYDSGCLANYGRIDFVRNYGAPSIGVGAIENEEDF